MVTRSEDEPKTLLFVDMLGFAELTFVAIDGMRRLYIGAHNWTKQPFVSKP
jgi:hypothetical protein